MATFNRCYQIVDTFRIFKILQGKGPFETIPPILHMEKVRFRERKGLCLKSHSKGIGPRR